VPDLARFTAALERAMRTEGGGRSVSSTLFVGEALEGGGQRWITPSTLQEMDEGLVDDAWLRRKAKWEAYSGLPISFSMVWRLA
jgi:hypothetical protein